MSVALCRRRRWAAGGASAGGACGPSRWRSSSSAAATRCCRCRRCTPRRPTRSPTCPRTRCDTSSRVRLHITILPLTSSYTNRVRSFYMRCLRTRHLAFVCVCVCCVTTDCVKKVQIKLHSDKTDYCWLVFIEKLYIFSAKVDY